MSNEGYAPENLKNAAVFSIKNSGPLKIEISEPKKVPASNIKMGKMNSVEPISCRDPDFYGDPERRTASKNRGKNSHVQDIFLKSDIHGLPEWYQAEKRSTKVCWTIILLLAFILLIYGLVKSAKDFADNPILTTYSIVSDAHGIKFPDLFFCPLKPVHDLVRSQSGINETWEKEMNISEYFEASNKIYGKEGGILRKKIKIWEQIGGNIAWTGPAPPPVDGYSGSPTPAPLPQYVWTPKNVQEYFMGVGYKVSTLFQECAFNSKPIECEHIITPFFDRDYGKCFIVRRKFWQTLPGVGLSLVINLDTANAVGLEPKNRPLFDGIIMKVDQEFDPGNYWKIYLKPGLNTQATLELKKFNLIERERAGAGMQRCVDNTAGKQSLAVMNAKYSLGVCHMDCVQKLIISKCGCALAMDVSIIKDDVIQNLPPDIFCNITHRKYCADILIEKAQENEEMQECTGACKVPCELYEYKTELSFLNFPSSSFKPLLNSGSTASPFEYSTTVEPSWVKNDHSNYAESLRNIEQSANYLYWGQDSLDVKTEINEMIFVRGEIDVKRKAQWEMLLSALSNVLGQLSSAATPEDAMRSVINIQPNFSKNYNSLMTIIEKNLDQNFTQDSKFVQFFAEFKNLSEDIRKFDFPIRFLINDTYRILVAYDSYFEQLLNKSDIYSLWTSVKYFIFLLAELYQNSSEYQIATDLTDFWNNNSTTNYSDVMLQVGSILAEQNNTVSDYDLHLLTRTVNNVKLMIEKSFKLLETSKDDQIRSKRNSVSNDELPSFEEMKNNYIVLDVAFASLQYIEVTQEPSMTFDTFVSNIGGQVGLWVGASIVTLIKFFTILWPVLLDKMWVSRK